LLVTESVFSMQGDLAPLRELRALCDQHQLGLYVDEAHALGVLGPQGRGACAALGVVPDVLVGTLGKAFGCSGAFAAGRDDTVRLLENRSRTHVFSTAAPPLLAAAISAAVDLVERADERRARLLAHAARIREALAAIPGQQPYGALSPIVRFHVGRADAVQRLSAELLEAGIFVHGIRPPTVPDGTSRLRITPMATHQDAHVTRLLEALHTAWANHK
jgi:7-keto-8-aminopelargonate synthetase-like enzyme